MDATTVLLDLALDEVEENERDGRHGSVLHELETAVLLFLALLRLLRALTDDPVGVEDHDALVLYVNEDAGLDVGDLDVAVVRGVLDLVNHMVALDRGATEGLDVLGELVVSLGFGGSAGGHVRRLDLVADVVRVALEEEVVVLQQRHRRLPRHPRRKPRHVLYLIRRPYRVRDLLKPCSYGGRASVAWSTHLPSPAGTPYPGSPGLPLPGSPGNRES